MTAYWCEYAVLPDDTVGESVRVEVSGGRFSSISPGAGGRDAVRLAGLTIPGLANCHSHAFHRALRSRTQRGRGSFWTWREQMYSLAGRLTPDTYFALARAVYREMAAAGITSVGEFHYLHHQVDGTPYDDANVFGVAMIEAAREAGIRIALLDTCYLASGIGSSPEGVQCRFDDGSVDAWVDRIGGLSAQTAEGVVIGAAAHSVRAVPRAALATIGQWAKGKAAPLHAHVSEQVAENDACLDAYGCTPTQLLEQQGLLGPMTSAVHVTHLSQHDVMLLGESATVSCFCPTTERDLGDGIGPAKDLEAAGSVLTLGSDSHAIIDPFEEMRGLELDERLASQLRGHWTAAELLRTGAAAGHASLGFPDGGRLEVGARADLVTLDLGSARTAGGGPSMETVIFAASAADVVHVVCDGKVVARREDHSALGQELASAIAAAWGEA